SSARGGRRSFLVRRNQRTWYWLIRLQRGQEYSTGRVSGRSVKKSRSSIATSYRKIRLLRQAVFREDKFLHRLSTDEVFLNDPFEHFRGDGVIPDSFRIDDGDRTLLANFQ